MCHALPFNRLNGHYRNVADVNDPLRIGAIKKFRHIQIWFVHDHDEVGFDLVAVFYNGFCNVVSGDGLICAGNSLAFNELFNLVGVRQELVFVSRVGRAKNAQDPDAGTKILGKLYGRVHFFPGFA